MTSRLRTSPTTKQKREWILSRFEPAFKLKVGDYPLSFLFFLYLQEQFVETGVFVEFGVEGYAELAALAGGDDAPVNFR